MRKEELKDSSPKGADVSLRPPRSAVLIEILVPAVILALITLFFFYPVLFQNKVFLPADLLNVMQPWRSLHLPFAGRPYNPILDAIQQYFPWRKFASVSFHQGVIPLWNPYYFAGVPFLANNQSALLYPLNIIFWTFPVDKAFGYAASLHFFLAGLFMFLLLRHLCLSRLPSLFGAAAFMLSGFFFGWMQFPTFASVGVWLPLVLLLTSKALRNWPFAIPAGFILGLQFLAGHLQISTYLFIVFLGFVLFQLISVSPSRRLPFFGVALLILVLALGIGSAQFLPTFEYSHFNYPKGGSYSEIIRGAYSPLEALLFFIPNIFGNPVNYNDSAIRTLLSSTWHYELRNYFEACNYVGLTTLFLAPLAFFFSPRSPRSRSTLFFYLSIAVFALLAAFPTPVNWLLYRFAPGFRQLVHLTRVVYLWDFALAALAAFALHSLLNSRQMPRKTLFFYIFSASLIAVFVALLAFAVTSFPPSSDPRLYHYCSSQVVRFLLLSAIALTLIGFFALKPSRYLLAALFLLLLVDLFPFARRLNPMVDGRILRTTPSSLQICQKEPQFRIATVGPNFLNRLPPNVPSAFALRHIQGTDSFCPRWYWQVLSQLQQDDEFGLSRGLRSPFLNLLGVKFVLAPPDYVLPADFPLLAQPDASLYLNPNALSRARWLPEALFLPPDQALRNISQGLVDLRTTVLLSAPSPSKISSVNPQPSASNSEVSIVSDSLNEVVVRCSSSAPGFLLLADNYYPGWRAYLDGNRTPIFFADASFRAVQVPPGQHLLRFAFLPSSFKVGFFALLCSLMGGTSVLVYAGIRRTKCLEC